MAAKQGVNLINGAKAAECKGNGNVDGKDKDSENVSSIFMKPLGRKFFTTLCSHGLINWRFFVGFRRGGE
jgi:hypothetical protein